MGIILIGAAAFAGGIATALLGYTESAATWDWRKFASSAIRSLVGAVGIAVVIDFTGEVTPILYLMAFLIGAGVEVGGNRLMGAIRKTK